MAGSADVGSGEDLPQGPDAVLVRAEPGPLTALFARDEPGVGEHLQVVAHGRLREADRIVEIARAALTGRSDEGEQL